MQVVYSEGNTGHNVEYVLRLAEWIRDTMPDVEDDHLFSLEAHIRQKVVKDKLCLNSLMGGDDLAKKAELERRESEASMSESESSDEEQEETEEEEEAGAEVAQAAGNDGAAATATASGHTAGYTKECCRKCLKCLKV